MAFGEIISPPSYQPVDYLKDALLTGQVQQAMQQRYDVNSAKLEEMVQKVSSVPILQNDAKRYLQEKVQGLVNTVNANLKVSGGRSILSNSATNSIIGYIGGAIDDKVKKHIKYSQDIANFEQGVAKLKEKDPKSYNQANYEFAQHQAGLQNYLSGTVDSDLGSLQYSPYKDYMTDSMEKATKLKQLKGDMVVEKPDPNNPNRMIKTTVEGLTAEEVMKYVPGILTAQDEQQMMIDGWYEFKNNPTAARKSMTDFLTTKNEQLAKEIESYKAYDKNSNKETYDLAQSRIKDYEAQIAENTAQLGKVDSMPVEQIGYTLKKAQTQNVMGGLYTGRESIEYKINPEWEMSIKERELTLKEAELAQKGLKKNADGTYTQGLNPEEVFATPTSDQATTEPEQVYKNFRTAFNKSYDAQISLVKSVLTDPRNEKHKVDAFIANMDKAGYSYDAKTNDFTLKQGAKPSSKAQMMHKAFMDTEMNVLFPQEEAQLLNVDATRSRLSHALAEAEKGATYIKEGRHVVGYESFTDEEGNRIPIYSATSGKYLDEAKAGSKLLTGQSLGDIQALNSVTVTGGTAENLVKRIPVSANEGNHTFDPKKGNIQITKSTDGGKITIEQYFGKDKKGNDIKAVATVPASEGDVANYINTFTSERDNTLDVRDYRKNQPIISGKQEKLLLSSDDMPYDYKTEAIKMQVKDKALQNELLLHSVSSDAIESLAISLTKNYEPQQALGLAEKLVSNIDSGKVKVSVMPSDLGWYVNVGNFSLKISDGTKLNKDHYNAVMLHPKAYAISVVKDYIYKTKGNAVQKNQSLKTLFE